ncbi:hypothetical protein ACFL0O_01870 [Thermodesulfobacteriota bacterium]
MKHFKWLYVACIVGYYVFAVIATYVVPVSYDAWVTATCIVIFVIIGLSLYSEKKTGQQEEND